VCTTLTAYTVVFSSDSYVINAVCNPEGNSVDSTIQLPTGVQFSPLPSSLKFFVLTRGIDVSSETVLTLSGFSHTYRISAWPGGDIVDKGLQ